jgi:transposase
MCQDWISVQQINLTNGVTNMKCSVISIDLAKNILQIYILDEIRQVLFNNKVKRSELIPPFIVKPFVIGNKNDANDALAIAEHG